MISNTFFNTKRFPAREVKIGHLPLGGQQPIRLQSMTNTETLDIDATIGQCLRIINAGADYVRIATPNVKAAQALANIKQGLKNAGYNTPLIADIHFNADVALTAARLVEKVRINPGNYTGNIPKGKTTFSQNDTDLEKETIYQRLKPLTDVCKTFGTAIRIGTNFGSLSPRIVALYGNTPQAMVNATLEFLEVFDQLGFHELVISLKASKPMVMIQAYEEMVSKMTVQRMNYPLHIGITEAGEGENGRIKSALGICTLLNNGIGDTIRVSLTEAPEAELPFARKISSIYQIPFTQNQTGIYTPIKSDFSLPPIHFGPQKHKAVVIRSNGMYKKESGSCQASSSIEINRYKTNGKDQNPDYIFLKNNKPVSDSDIYAGQLVPSEQNNLESSAILVVDYRKLLESGLKDLPTTYYLLINCKEDDPHWLLEKSIVSPSGIILNLDDCTEEVDPANWIDYARQWEIPLVFKKVFNTSDLEEMIAHLAIFAGSYLMEKKLQGLWIDAISNGEDLTEMAFGFLQSAGIRITQTEWISCPTCARTSFDIERVIIDIRKKLPNLAGLKIAVMGCIVNGPGEMADADFGFVGTGKGKLHLYQGGSILKKNIDPKNAPVELLAVLKDKGLINAE